MADEKISLEVFVEADKADLTLKQLEEGFEQLQEKLKNTNRNTEEGRKEFRKLASQMAQTSKEIKNIELSFEGLDREQVASEIGSVAGAVGDLSASLIILSGDNETLQATSRNIEKAMMVSMGLKGAIEGLSSARKLYNNLIKQANEDEKEGIALTVLKTAKEKAAAAGTVILNTVNKLFNKTLKANPIGIFITALTLVVSGIIYFKDAIWDIIKTALKPFQFIIDLLIDGLQAMGIMASDEAIAQEEAAKKIIEASQKRREEIDKLIKAEKEKTDTIVRGLNYEIAQRKIWGKETSELEKQKLDALKNSAKEELKLSKEKLKAIEDEITAKVKLGDATTEEADELVAEYKEIEEAVKSRSIAFENASNNLKLFNQQAKKDYADEKAAYVKGLKEKEAADKEASKKRRAQRKKDAEAQKKIDEKAAADAIQLEKDKNQLLEDLQAKAIENKNIRALAELELAQERERQQLIEKYGLDTELMLALEEEQLLQMNTLIEGIEQEARDKKAEIRQLELDAQKEADAKELEDEKQKAADKQKIREQSLAASIQVIESISSLNEMALQNDLKNAGDNEAKKEQLRKASFEREKKLNIAMALVNGAQAQMSILAQTPKADFGIATAIAMAAAAVTTIAQIAAIKATSYQGGGSPAASESATAPSAGGAGAAGGGAAITPVSNTSTILGGQQVFVTETDITETQNNVSVIEESATF